MNQKRLIDSIHMVITERHQCDSLHIKSVPVDLHPERDAGRKIMVEVFDLIGHATTRQCFAWIDQAEKHGKSETFVTVLQIPPVVSAETAVEAFLESKSKMRKQQPPLPAKPGKNHRRSREA